MQLLQLDWVQMDLEKKSALSDVSAVKAQDVVTLDSVELPCCM